MIRELIQLFDRRTQLRENLHAFRASNAGRVSSDELKNILERSKA
jgi:hypothetical protein